MPLIHVQGGSLGPFPLEAGEAGKSPNLQLLGCETKPKENWEFNAVHLGACPMNFFSPSATVQ